MGTVRQIYRGIFCFHFRSWRQKQQFRSENWCLSIKLLAVTSQTAVAFIRIPLKTSNLITFGYVFRYCFRGSVGLKLCWYSWMLKYKEIWSVISLILWASAWGQHLHCSEQGLNKCVTCKSELVPCVVIYAYRINTSLFHWSLLTSDLREG
jgi:hypothetical protein